jgi:hypothetical protein
MSTVEEELVDNVWILTGRSMLAMSKVGSQGSNCSSN